MVTTHRLNPSPLQLTYYPTNCCLHVGKKFGKAKRGVEVVKGTWTITRDFPGQYNGMKLGEQCINQSY